MAREQIINTSLKIYSRSEHQLSRRNICDNALQVLYRLKSKGYDSYLVGGSVRDLLLDKEPKDFDIATNAEPAEVCALFNRSRLIGRRFRLAHIYFGRDVIEVATFRGACSGSTLEHVTDAGRILNDNVFGTIEEDALRRDFTINALYYNIRDYSVVDYAGGIPDLKARVLRLIGDPETRYREDPVRMLRAVRFSAKLDFTIHGDSKALLSSLGYLLEDISPSRLFEEIKKLFLSGNALSTYKILRENHLFQHLFPYTEQAVQTSNNESDWDLIEKAMVNTDIRIREDKPVTPAFLLAVLLWPATKEKVDQIKQNNMSPVQALEQAGALIARKQIEVISIPKRFSHPMREIWKLQPRFNQNSEKNAARLMRHPKFRAAYDFLLLRSEVGEVDQKLVQWWTEIQKDNEFLDHKRTVSSRRWKARNKQRGKK